MSSRLNGTLVFLPLKILFTLLLFYLSYIAEGLINLCTPLKLHLKVVWAVFGLHYIPPTLFQNQAYKVYRIKKSFHST